MINMPSFLAVPEAVLSVRPVMRKRVDNVPVVMSNVGVLAFVTPSVMMVISDAGHDHEDCPAVPVQLMVVAP